jgi:hypothetical protein
MLLLMIDLLSTQFLYLHPYLNKAGEVNDFLENRRGVGCIYIDLRGGLCNLTLDIYNMLKYHFHPCKFIIFCCKLVYVCANYFDFLLQISPYMCKLIRMLQIKNNFVNY